MSLESFPDRPLRADTVRALEGSPRVSRAYSRFEVGEHVDDPHDFRPEALVVQLVLVLEIGAAVAAHFDPVSRSWSRLSSAVVDPDDVDNVKRALEQLDEILEAERDGDQRYGEAVCVELGMWDPDRAEVYRRE